MLYSYTAVVFNVGENTPRGRFGDLRDLGGDFSFQEGDFHWCKRRGSRRIPKYFDVVKIPEKINGNMGKISELHYHLPVCVHHAASGVLDFSRIVCVIQFYCTDIG